MSRKMLSEELKILGALAQSSRIRSRPAAGLEVKGMRDVGYALGKHQLKKASTVTGRQCVGTAETRRFEGITKKDRKDPGEVGWE